MQGMSDEDILKEFMERSFFQNDNDDDDVVETRKQNSVQGGKSLGASEGHTVYPMGERKEAQNNSIPSAALRPIGANAIADGANPSYSLANTASLIAAVSTISHAPLRSRGGRVVHTIYSNNTYHI